MRSVRLGILRTWNAGRPACDTTERRGKPGHAATSWRRRTGAFVAAMSLSALALCARAAPLSAEIQGLSNDRGIVRCGLFSGEPGWREEGQAIRRVEAAIAGGVARCDFGDVPAGQYAIAVFHAQEGEEKVSYGLLGKPRQGVGFSNNPSITFGPPDYARASFQLGTAPMTLSIQVKY